MIKKQREKKTMLSGLVPSDFEVKSSHKVHSTTEPKTFSPRTSTGIIQHILSHFEESQEPLTLEIKASDIASLMITGYDHASSHVPELEGLQFDVDPEPSGKYRVRVSVPTTSSPFFQDQEIQKALETHHLHPYKFTGSLPKPFAWGTQGLLYSVPGHAEWVMKLPKESEKTTLPDFTRWKYPQIVREALLLEKAHRNCKQTPAPIGPVWFPEHAGWGTIMTRIPHAESLRDWIRSQKDAKEAEKQLRQQTRAVGECLRRNKVLVDTAGLNNILVDKETGKVYFLDLDEEQSDLPEPTGRFHHRLNDYIDRLLH